MQVQIATARSAKKQEQSETYNADASIWTMLQSAGMSQMAELINTIHETAPQPGSLIIVDLKPLPFRWDEWQPVLFSAVDVCTHLQIARMYVTSTQASAIDFLQFMAERYPFPITEIRTAANPEFTKLGSLQSNHQFTAEARKRGIFHSIALDTTEQPILSLASKYSFAATLEGNLDGASKEKIVNGLTTFLFFHNNHRSLASLGGLTPLQKLNSFEGYEHIPWFDPYVPNEIRKAGNGSH